MVAVKLYVRCAHCDSEDLEMSPVSGEEDLVMCTYCQAKIPMEDLQDSAAAQLERFKEQGLPAVIINKHSFFM